MHEARDLLIMAARQRSREPSSNFESVLHWLSSELIDHGGDGDRQQAAGEGGQWEPTQMTYILV